MSQTASPAMQTGATSRRHDRTAIGSSIVLHLCVLAVIVMAPRPPSFPSEEPNERILLTSITRLEPAPTPRRRHAAAAAAPRSQPVVPPRLRVAVATAHARRPLVVAAENRYATPAPPARPALQQRPLVAPVLPVPTTPPPVAARPTTAAPVAARPAAATPAVVAVAVTPSPAPAADRDAGQGNFGETYPARPVPGLLDALRAKVPHLVARITVDERGRATDVVVVTGAADAGLREEITRTLLAARYIPASCNGLGCIETFELRT